MCSTQTMLCMCRSHRYIVIIVCAQICTWLVWWAISLDDRHYTELWHTHNVLLFASISLFFCLYASMFFSFFCPFSSNDLFHWMHIFSIHFHCVSVRPLFVSTQMWIMRNSIYLTTYWECHRLDGKSLLCECVVFVLFAFSHWTCICTYTFFRRVEKNIVCKKRTNKNAHTLSLQIQCDPLIVHIFYGFSFSIPFCTIRSLQMHC